MSEHRWDDFTGRTVVVTGCSSGIGAATARELLDRGAHVIGLDLRAPDLPGVERVTGGWVAKEGMEFIKVDLADSDSIAQAAARIPTPVHALINAAGVSSGIMDPLKVVSINFVGTRELTEALVSRMPPDSYVVCLSSLAAANYRARRNVLSELLATHDREAAVRWCRDHPDALGNGYALSKEAVILYTAAMAVPLARAGVRINCTAPGVTDTPILRDSIASLGQAYLDAIPKPLGRIATPQEQARVVVFLAGPGASYVTGQTIWVDGGYTAGAETGAFDGFEPSR